MVEAITITYIWGGGLIAFMIILMVFLTIVYTKLQRLNDIVETMQKNPTENTNQGQEFHIRRPNQIKLESEYNYSGPENPQGFPSPVQNLEQRGNQYPAQNNEYRFGGPQPQSSSLLGVPGKREAPKPPPKNANPQNDSYFGSNNSEDPFRKPQGNYLSDEMFRKNSQMSTDMFRKTSQMSNDNYSKNNPSRTRSNLDNNNFFY